MDNPGSFLLGSFPIGAPGTQISTPVTTLAGMLATTLQARFAYGGGGTTCKAYFQTTFDQGQTWCDVACIAFATASGVDLVNLSGLQPVTAPAAPTDGALADNTVLDGPLGDQMRVKTISTGTYTGQTLLSCWGVAR